MQRLLTPFLGSSPDKWRGDATCSRVPNTRPQRAYDVLSNEQERRQYDRHRNRAADYCAEHDADCGVDALRGQASEIRTTSTGGTRRPPVRVSANGSDKQSPKGAAAPVLVGGAFLALGSSDHDRDFQFRHAHHDLRRLRFSRSTCGAGLSPGPSRIARRASPRSRRPSAAARRVGQIHAVQANLRHPASVEAAVRDSAVVIDLVGILFERGRQRFAAVHAGGAEVVARAAAPTARASFMYPRSAPTRTRPPATRAPRGSARRRCSRRFPKPLFFALRSFLVPTMLSSTSLRQWPGWRLSCLCGRGTDPVQPVFGGDVGEAVAKAVANETMPGTIYELGGPESTRSRS